MFLSTVVRVTLIIIFFMVSNFLSDLTDSVYAAQKTAANVQAESSPNAPPSKNTPKNEDAPIAAASDSNNEPAEGEQDKAEEKPKAEQTIAPVTEAWEKLWDGQQEIINEIRETAIDLNKNFSRQTENLTLKLQPFEEQARRLMVFINIFKGYPQPLEAIIWRIRATLDELNVALEPVNRSRLETETLLTRVTHMAASLPNISDKSRLSEEMAEYADSITRARMRLIAVLAEYNTLLPSFGLVTQLQDEEKNLAAEMPVLWKNYYLQKPVGWLNPDVWAVIPNHLSYTWQIIMMRLPIEIPSTVAQWGAAILRFCIGLILGGAIALMLKRKWINPTSSQAAKHIYKEGFIWMILGSSILGSAFSAGGDVYHFFLAIGCGCVIMSEVLIAWDLRLLEYPDVKFRRSPFMRFVPLTIGAYILMYLPLPPPVTLVIWIVFLIIGIVLHRGWNKFSEPKMQLEMGVRECAPLIMWPCLFLAVSGLPLYSIIFYLCFIAISLASEWSLGGMSIVSRINELLPQEGAQAVVARLGVALSAPMVLVLAVGGLCLWVLMLPGGTYLLGEYALKGFSVGATQFNIIQILIIISAFYLTRTVVSMGTRFISKLPGQGANFDATLITPMQTAFTYLTWAVFCLFALHSLGVSLSNLAVIAGGLSVGIGFGMQTIVNNFISGLILIFGRTLQVGDIVEVGQTTGRVRKISVRATMVETFDNAIIYVPNSEFMSGRLTNWTSFTRSMRCQIAIGVAYGSDTSKVISLLINIAKNNDNVLKYPVPSVIFEDFGASTLDFKLRFWVRDYDLSSSTKSNVRLAINQVFAENNIEIAFPQLDVHLKDWPERSSNEAVAQNKGNNRTMGKMDTLVKRPRKPVNPKIMNKTAIKIADKKNG